MKVYILAVTKASDKYCIAGMDDNGNWVRPISSSPSTRFWSANELTFENDFGFIRVGDVIEFEGIVPSQYQHQNHNEDIIVSSTQPIRLVNRLTNDELFDFLHGKDESKQAFDKTVNAQGRSLCLVKVSGFQHQITQYQSESQKPKMTFTNNDFNVTNPKTTPGNYIVKDCKWCNIVLNGTINNDKKYADIYLAIGLATAFGVNHIEYPQVIGLITNPEVPLPNNYPN